MGKFTTKEFENNEKEFNNLTDKLIFKAGEAGLSNFLSGRFTHKTDAEYNTFVKQREELELGLNNALKDVKPCPFCNASDNLSIYVNESRSHNDAGFNDLGVECSCGGSKSSGIYGYGSPTLEDKMKAIVIWNSRG